MFRRLNNQGDYTGHGIGLDHCKRIVELHNGELWIKSNLGEGSTFYSLFLKKNNVVLLIDDELTINYFHNRLIEKLGIAEQIAVALNSMEGLVVF